ncbi:MAG: hypothetical protein R2744_04645 [Bacteroidales bacterium]
MGAEPILLHSGRVELAVLTGTKSSRGMIYSDIVVETATRLNKILKKVYVQSKSFDDLIAMAIEKEDMLRSHPCHTANQQ